MIATTITLNPCLDRREYLESFRYGETNRPYKTELSAGGKGINVSKALIDLVRRYGDFKNLRVNTVSYAGGKNGEIFKSLLDRELSLGEAISGVTLIPSSFETRVCTKLITPGAVSEINEAGRLSKTELMALVDVLADLVAMGNEQLVFLSGSMPTVVGEDGFTQNDEIFKSFPQLVGSSVENFLITLLESCGIPVIVDTSKESLVESLKASPTLIKPNEAELSDLFGRPFSSKQELVDFCRELYVDNGSAVLCTLGEKGAVYVGKEGIFEQESHRVFPCDPTGAGDTFLAAFSYGYFVKKEDPKTALAFADRYTREYLINSLS